jgi:hypothetical protein
MSAHSKDRLEFNFESGARGDGGAKIRDALFAGERMRLAGLPRRGSARRNEGGIHAGQRDEFGQEFFRARHAAAAYQANIPPSRTTTRLFRTNNRTLSEDILAWCEHIGVLN